MDRWRKKRNTWGGDSLDFWYLTPNISGKDVIAAYKFFHTKDETEALMNVNPNGYYPLLKPEGKVPTYEVDDESGEHLGYKFPQGKALNNANIADTDVVTTIIRVKTEYFNTSTNVGWLVNPTPTYHLGIGFSIDTFHNGAWTHHTQPQIAIWEQGKRMLRAERNIKAHEYIFGMSPYHFHGICLEEDTGPYGSFPYMEYVHQEFSGEFDDFGAEAEDRRGDSAYSGSMTIGPTGNLTRDCTIKALAFYNKDIGNDDFESIANKILKL